MKKSDEFENPHAALKYVVAAELFSPECFYTDSEEEIWEEPGEVVGLTFLILSLPDSQTLSDHKVTKVMEACVYSIALILALTGIDQSALPYNYVYKKEERMLHFFATSALPPGCYNILAAALFALTREIHTNLFIEEMRPVIDESDPYPHFNPAVA